MTLCPVEMSIPSQMCHPMCQPIAIFPNHMSHTCMLPWLLSTLCSGRSRALFCYDCILPLAKDCPTVPLPFPFSIITHSDEAVGGSYFTLL